MESHRKATIRPFLVGPRENTGKKNVPPARVESNNQVIASHPDPVGCAHPSRTVLPGQAMMARIRCKQ